MKNDSKMNHESGLTLIEVSISAAFMVPILFAMITMGNTVSKATAVNEARSRATEVLRTITANFERCIRSASLVTIATEDPNTNTQKAYGTTNSWTKAQSMVKHTSLKFQAVDKAPTESSSLGVPVAFRFELDPDEAKNGLDDDGDGLVDEGRLVMYRGPTANPVVLASAVEKCDFIIADGAVTVSLTVAAKVGPRRLVRSQLSKTYFLRNP